ncbi:MAG: hypothetical protein NXI24_03505 [bacterium]|nr:hypothetical protein [bacterium]
MQRSNRIPVRPTGSSRRRHILASPLAGLFCALLGTTGLAFLPSGSLQAQLTCTGAVCETIPVSSEEYNRLFNELQLQYTNDLFDRMAEAMVISNLATPYTGTVNLNDAWTFGANVAAGYTEADEVDISATNVGVIEDVPTAGAAINGRFFVGVNVGKLFGMTYDPFAGDSEDSEEGEESDNETPAFYSPARFDVYYGGLKHTERFNNEKGVTGSLRATTRSESVEIRYHLVEGSDLAGGSLLRFRGVSLGVGYSSMAQRLRYSAGETDTLTISLQEGINLEWLGQNFALLENNVRSTMIELRTGVQLLYFLNLTIGGGYAQNKGQTDFFLTRFGPVIIAQNPFESFFNTPESANLSLTLLERGEIPADLYYFKAGIEFNIAIFKLGIEGIMTRRNYGASVGARFEF